MTSEGLLFSALCGANAAERLRTAFANAVRNPVARIVGYGTESTGKSSYQGVGSFFFSLGANIEKVDLTSITVNCVGGSEYMDPTSLEYIRQLNPANAGDMKRYTYINEVFCDAVGLTGEDIKATVGWYEWTPEYDWESGIASMDKKWKITPGSVLFDVQQAFLGQFGGGDYGCDFQFVCNGQVICDTTEFQSGKAQYYLFHNWTPTNVKLTEIEVECEGGSEYMDPTSLEYIRQLDPANAGDVKRYTYINAVFCEAVGLQGSDIDEMVGWYEWTPEYDWESGISSKDKTWKVGDKASSVSDVVLTPGFAFLGQFGGGDYGCNFHFKFPNPIR